MKRKGKIIRLISNLYTVESEGKSYECRARGKFKNQNITPLVGEDVVFDDEANYILECMPRRNELERPPVVNVDIALIITSVKKPDFSTVLLDKELLNVSSASINPIICLTKCDLLSREEKKKIKYYVKAYKKIGYRVITNQNLRKLKKLIKGKIVVLTGQTGAGKSTLLNKLDKNLNLKTSEISKALGRGVHTTRYVELYKVAGAFVVDTPGFSALDITVKKDEIKYYYPEFKSDGCKYSNCNHDEETMCRVKEDYKNGKILASRYENYIKFRSEK